MKIVKINPRTEWQTKVEELGFNFHSIYNEVYWNENRAVEFTLDEIENGIEDPTAELMSMCYHAVDHVCNNPSLLTKLDIPAAFHDAIIKSWKTGQRDIYGRFDLSFNNGVAKMLEFNADTPTSLLESAVVQWDWLEDKIKAGELTEESDQFNSLHEKLIDAFTVLLTRSETKTFHFAVIMDSVEDTATVEYMAGVAMQAGFTVKMLCVTELGVDEESNFIDNDGAIIENIFKLYPYEDMMREEFGIHLTTTKTNLFEPLWKSILSNKGILPILWQLYPNHENLLPAYFENEDMPLEEMFPTGEYVVKPIFSREGANVEIIETDGYLKTEGAYGGEKKVMQGLAKLPKLGDDYVVIGSWVVAGSPAGICIRADVDPITKNTSQFIPHYIKD